jgi:intraflagellar transport protein 140
VTEELAEKLTMDKSLGNEEERSQVLLAVAESAQVQGNYHLAAKKFTQAGDRVRN